MAAAALMVRNGCLVQVFQQHRYFHDNIRDVRHGRFCRRDLCPVNGDATIHVHSLFHELRRPLLLYAQISVSAIRSTFMPFVK